MTLLGALNFALPSLVAGLLALQPVAKLFAVAVICIPNHLVVALFAT